MPRIQPSPAANRSTFIRIASAALLAVGFAHTAGEAALATGDPAEGARVFRACVACHSLEPGRHRTGPSLAGVLGRKAGSAPGFRRYSPALTGSGVIWDAVALDAWLRDPADFIPGNRMTFPGLPDDQVRADLLAYLEEATNAGAAERRPNQGGGMMGGGELPDLKSAGPQNRVTGLRHCGDTYEVATADGASEPFWEFNLRFKTDSSDLGPEPGRPVIVDAGMMGDRAAIVFRSPKEISAFIQDQCPN